MNALVRTAQLSQSVPVPPQAEGQPVVRLERPVDGAAVVVRLQPGARVDFTQIANEPIVLVRSGERLIVLFQDRSSLVLYQAFDSQGQLRADTQFEVQPGQTVASNQFAALFPISTDQSILPAAGPASSQGSQGSSKDTSDPTVGPPGSARDGLALLGGEDVVYRDTVIDNGRPGLASRNSQGSPESSGDTPGSTTPDPDPDPAPNNPRPSSSTIPDRLLVNEDGLPGGVPGGIGDAGGTATVVTGNLTYSFGADGASATNPITFASGPTSLTSGGEPVSLVWNAATLTLTGVAGEKVVFTLVVNDVLTGAYTFTQVGPVDHPIHGTEDTVSLPLSFTITDGNGDSAQSSLVVSINDDSPVVGSNESVLLSDATIAHGGEGAEASAGATGTVAFSPGADGGTVSLLTGGAPEGFTYAAGPDGTLLIQQNQGGTLVTVMTVTLDAVTGNYTVTQNAAVLHAAGEGANDQIFNIGYRVTDGDGDTADGNLSVVVRDDTPSASDSAKLGTVEEAAGTPTVTGALPTIDYGADGPAADPLTFATDVTASGPSGAPVALTSNGQAISYAFLDAAHTILVGYVGSTPPEGSGDSSIVFVLTVSGSSYEFALRQPLDHPAPVGGQHFIDVSFSVVATDADGDSVASALAIRIDAAGAFQPDAATIDYSAVPTGVFINLSDVSQTIYGETVAANTATDRASVTDDVLGRDALGTTVVNAVGTDKNDIIVGGEEANVLSGGGGDDRIDGGGGDDRIFGGAGDDVVMAGGGNDYVEGGAGDDTISGGAGKDVIYGQSGDDTIDGGDDDDELHGGSGNDLITAGAGHDLVYGGSGDDNIFLGDGDDYAEGGSGDDTIEGGNGNDTIFAGSGNDAVYGGAGDDGIILGTDNDFADGGEGDDIIQGDDGDDVIHGGGGNDSLDGGKGNDTIYGEEGDDLITAGDGADRVFGGAGDDQIFLGAGDDYAEGGTGDDNIEGGDGNDVILAGDGADVVFGDAGNDTLRLGEGDDVGYGGDGNDIIYGEGGRDVIFGGAGDDQIVGGAGADRLTGGSGADAFVYLGRSEGGDVIMDFEHGVDRIEVTAGVGADQFGVGNAAGGATTGTLDANRFVSDSTGFTNSNQRFWFDTGSHNLYFDADGSGAGASVLVAKIENSIDIQASDIRLV